MALAKRYRDELIAIVVGPTVILLVDRIIAGIVAYQMGATS